jgi:malate dehydrogenase
MAFAGARFADSLLQAAVGKKKGITECTYVNTEIVDGLEYFSTIVELGPNGVEKIHPLPSFDDNEKKLFDEAVPELKSSIEKGQEFVRASL